MKTRSQTNEAKSKPAVAAGPIGAPKVTKSQSVAFQELRKNDVNRIVTAVETLQWLSTTLGGADIELPAGIKTSFGSIHMHRVGARMRLQFVSGRENDFSATKNETKTPSKSSGQQSPPTASNSQAAIPITTEQQHGAYQMSSTISHLTMPKQSPRTQLLHLPDEKVRSAVSLPGQVSPIQFDMICVPFVTLLAVAQKIQLILEHACWAYGVKHFPKYMRMKGWEHPSLIEVSVWLDSLASAPLPANDAWLKEADAPCTIYGRRWQGKAVFAYVKQIRHCVVHRLKPTVDYFLTCLECAIFVQNFHGGDIEGLEIVRHCLQRGIGRLQEDRSRDITGTKHSLMDLVLQRQKLQKMADSALRKLLEDDRERIRTMGIEICHELGSFVNMPNPMVVCDDQSMAEAASASKTTSLAENHCTGIDAGVEKDAEPPSNSPAIQVNRGIVPIFGRTWMPAVSNYALQSRSTNGSAFAGYCGAFDNAMQAKDVSNSGANQLSWVESPINMSAGLGQQPSNQSLHVIDLTADAISLTAHSVSERGRVIQYTRSQLEPLGLSGYRAHSAHSASSYMEEESESEPMSRRDFLGTGMSSPYFEGGPRTGQYLHAENPGSGHSSRHCEYVQMGASPTDLPASDSPGDCPRACIPPVNLNSAQDFSSSSVNSTGNEKVHQGGDERKSSIEDGLTTYPRDEHSHNAKIVGHASGEMSTAGTEVPRVAVVGLEPGEPLTSPTRIPPVSGNSGNAGQEAEPAESASIENVAVPEEEPMDLY